MAGTRAHRDGPAGSFGFEGEVLFLTPGLLIETLERTAVSPVARVE